MKGVKKKSTRALSMVFVFVFSLVGPPINVSSTAAGYQTGEISIMEFQQEMLSAINAVRARGVTSDDGVWHPPVPPLTWNDQLEKAALRHSTDMHNNNFMCHTGSDSSTPWERIKDAGYHYSMAAENVARFFKTVDDVMDAWLGSPGHCANIMRDDVTEVGAARVGDAWTQVFARPAGHVMPDPDTDYTLAIESSDGGTVIEPGEEVYTRKHEDSIKVTAKPETGYKFVNWTADEHVVSEEKEFSYKMPANNVTLKANFSLKPFNITLSAVPAEGGTLTGECIYNYGEEVTVKAKPADGFSFVNWIDNMEIISDNKEYSFIADSDRHLEAVFIEDELEQTETPVIISEAAEVNSLMIKAEGTVEPHANIRVTGGAAEATGTADGDGIFNIEVFLVPDRLNTLEVTALAEGKAESEAASFEITHNTIETDEKTATPELTTNTTETVNLKTIIIEGAAEPEAVVIITGGATTEVTGVANEAGKFSAEVALEPDTVNLLSITAQASDKMMSEAATVEITHETIIRFGHVLDKNEITVADAIAVLRHIVGLTDLKDTGEYPAGAYERAKVSGKEDLSVGDAILILRYIVGLIEEFPATENNK